MRCRFWSLGWRVAAGASDHYAAARAARHHVSRGRGARQENVAIAVEPYDTKEKESIFRVDYLATA